MKNYFDLLEQTLEEYDLFDNHAQIVNCDEMGFLLNTPLLALWLL